MKSIISILLVCLCAIGTQAQKLPTEQQVSLRAPANIKVDGKAAEWNNTFQAYNKHVDFYYTMANDDDKLYLTVQVTDPSVIRRICSTGITLTINKAGKKDDKGGISITYPVFDENNRFTPMLKYRSFTSPPSEATAGVSVNIVQTNIKMPDNSPTIQTDSFINATNKTMLTKAKTIRTTGIKDVDTVISIYNTDGIKAASLFDNKMTYTLELSITLKQLGLSAINPDKFTYHLRINEVKDHGINITKDPSGNITSVVVTKGAEQGQASTDFWADYTLAKQ
jgi:hypothetical protein